MAIHLTSPSVRVQGHFDDEFSKFIYVCTICDLNMGFYAIAWVRKAEIHH